MAKQNAYLAKQAAVNHGYFTAGLQSGRQQILDLLSIALRDPEIVGKDIMGNRIFSPLFIGQVVKTDTRHLGHTQLLAGQHSAVTFNDDILLAPNAD